MTGNKHVGHFMHPDQTAEEKAKFDDTDVKPIHKATIGQYLKELSEKNTYKASSQDLDVENGYPEASENKFEAPSPDTVNDTFLAEMKRLESDAVSYFENLSNTATYGKHPENRFNSLQKGVYSNVSETTGNAYDNVNKGDLSKNNNALLSQISNNRSGQTNLNNLSGYAPGQFKNRFSDLDNLDDKESLVNMTGGLNIAASLMLGATGDRVIKNELDPNSEIIADFEDEAIKNNFKLPIKNLFLGTSADAPNIPAATAKVDLSNLKPKDAASYFEKENINFVSYTKDSFGNLNSYFEPFENDFNQSLVGPMLRISIISLIGCVVQSLKIALICEGILIAKNLTLKLGGINPDDLYVSNYYEPGINSYDKGASKLTGGKIDLSLDNLEGNGFGGKIADLLKKIVASLPAFMLDYLNIKIPYYVIKNAKLQNNRIKGAALTLTAFTQSVIVGFIKFLIATVRDLGGSSGFFAAVYRGVLRSNLETARDTGFNLKLLPYFKKLRDSKILGFLRIISSMGDIAVAGGFYGKNLFSENYVKGNNFLPSIRVSHIRDNSGKNVLSNSLLPSMLLYNPRADMFQRDNMAMIGLTTRKGQTVSGELPVYMGNNKNKQGTGYSGVTVEHYIDIEEVKNIEKALEAEYMPFYFHDTRTNEIVSFHAFLNSLSDSYSANYNSQKGFGRIEGTQVYSDTTRSLSFDFTVVAYSSSDMDEMYAKINKLTTLVYPQWSKGTTVLTENLDGKEGGTIFTQPFSQIPTATPLVRVRLGDLIKNNYSRKALAKIHGVEDAAKLEITRGEEKQTKIHQEKLVKYSEFVSDNELYDFIQNVGSININEGSEEVTMEDFEAVGYKTNLDSLPKANIVINSLGFDPVPDVDTFIWSKPAVFNTFTTEYGNQPVVPFGSWKPDINTLRSQYLADHFGKHLRKSTRMKLVAAKVVDWDTWSFANKSTKENPTFSIGLMYTFEILGDEDYAHQWHYPQAGLGVAGVVPPKYISMLCTGYDKLSKKLRDKPIGYYISKTKKEQELIAVNTTQEVNTTISSAELDGFKKIFNDQNPIVRSFESTMSEGLAGVITSLTFDWGINTVPWDLEAGQRAPTICKVSLSLNPIHDITPGIDYNGVNRAPIYKVGASSNSLHGEFTETSDYGKSLIDSAERVRNSALDTFDDTNDSDQLLDELNKSDTETISSTISKTSPI